MPEIINNNRPIYEDRRRKGTGFTNTQDIIESNKQNLLGQTVATDVQKDITSANKQIGEQLGTFKEEADKTRLSWDDSVAGEKEQVTGMLSGIMQGDTDITGQDNKVQSYLSSNYRGPQDIDVSSSLYSKTKAVSDLGKKATSGAGREALLQRSFGNQAPYTTGQSRLDSMILGKTGQQELKDVSRSAQQVGTNLQDTQNVARNLAQKYATETRDFGTKYRGAVGDTQAEMQRQLDERVASKNYGTSAASLARSAYQDTGDIYSGLLNQAGSDTGRTYNYDLGQFQDIDATINSIAQQGDVNKLDALARMMGGTQSVVDTQAQDFDQYNALNNAALMEQLQNQQAGFEMQKGIAERAQTGSLGFGGLVGNLESQRDFLAGKTFDYLKKRDFAYDRHGYHGVSDADIGRSRTAVDRGLENLNRERDLLSSKYMADESLYNQGTDLQSILDKYRTGGDVGMDYSMTNPEAVALADRYANAGQVDQTVGDLRLRAFGRTQIV